MPPALPTTRLRWIKIGDQDVLFLDFCRAKVEDSLALVETFRQTMQGRPPQSVLLLTDVTDAAYDASIASRWKAARMEHAKAIRASAVYGLSGLVGMAVRGVVDMARLLGLPMVDKYLRIFESEADAVAWLGQQ